MPVLVVGGVATSAVEVMVGVLWFDMKISEQTASVAYYFCIEERDRLLRPLSGKFDGYVICFDIVYEFYQISLLCVQTANTCCQCASTKWYFHVLVGVKGSSLTCP